MNFDTLPVNYSRPGSLHLQPRLTRRGDLFAAFLNFQQNSPAIFMVQTALFLLLAGSIYAKEGTGC
jgi:hypothetical protein